MNVLMESMSRGVLVTDEATGVCVTCGKKRVVRLLQQRFCPAFEVEIIRFESFL